MCGAFFIYRGYNCILKCQVIQIYASVMYNIWLYGYAIQLQYQTDGLKSRLCGSDMSEYNKRTVPTVHTSNLLMTSMSDIYIYILIHFISTIRSFWIVKPVASLFYMHICFTYTSMETTFQPNMMGTRLALNHVCHTHLLIRTCVINVTITRTPPGIMSICLSIKKDRCTAGT